ncbi:MAG: hypothetical protein D6740_03655 [Alphaproteobacteria bacterium]|nr:MAG: hypothetical protein D6740_03655 [Alphaproteobacteria bacterium]
MLAEALTARPIPEAVRHFAAELAGRHEAASRAVLYYGSCLRTGVLEDRILDFHLIVDRYRAAYPGRPLLAAANALLPPNVFFATSSRARDGTGAPLKAKYNVVSLAQLSRLVGPRTRQVWFWARFAQPMALVFAVGEELTATLARLQRRALLTFLAAALPLAPDGADAATVFALGFTRTYGCELRAEPPEKGHELYALDAPFYDRLFAPALAVLGWPATADPQAAGGMRILAADPDMAAAEERRWRQRRLLGRSLSLLRLAKSAFTFSGGADYIAWKIRRHAGVEVELSDFDRRHPLLAGLRHYWRLKRMGAFR